MLGVNRDYKSTYNGAERIVYFGEMCALLDELDE